VPFREGPHKRKPERKNLWIAKEGAAGLGSCCVEDNRKKGALMTDEDIPLCVDRALVVAAENGQTDTVRALLDAGANVYVVDDLPLWLAALNGHADTVKALLDAGADVHADEDSALLLAAASGHTGTVKALLDGGANVHAKEDWVLRWAAKNGHIDTLRVLKEWIARGEQESAAGSETA
jgi:hypothetical protein